VTSLSLVALNRAEVTERERRDFHIYLDEFQTFTTLSLATMLSEFSQYHREMVLVPQYLSQLEEKVQGAIIGNAGTIITFWLGADDAQALEPEFSPEFSALDLMSLPNYRISIRLMIKNTVSRPFSAETLDDTIIK
jgi:hypothetical protein